MRWILCFMLSWASNSAVRAADDESDPYPHVRRHGQFVAELQSALERSDPAAVALLTDFPLRVNTPDRTQYLIPDERALQRYFASAFPPELRARIRTIRDVAPERVGGEDFMLAHGLLWLTIIEHDDGPRFRLKTVNVPGREEPHWPTLAMVCETPKHRIIIDLISAEQSRYRSWNLPRALTEKPDLELKGQRTSEGTGACQHPQHVFESGKTRITAIQGGCRKNEWPANTIVVEIDAVEVNAWGCL